MSKKNDDFFKKKKEWSIIKDELLGCYLKPYAAKIIHTCKPLVYVDCFAGKGKFDDGKPGSPLIALEIFKDTMVSTTQVGKPLIDTTFIDLNYANDLRANLSNYPRTNIIAGSYEDTIESCLASKGKCNVFLYIDPYGIKALDCSKFDTFSNGQFNTIELLINMNSFGFIREACRVMGGHFTIEDSFFDDLIEYAPTELDASSKSIELLNKIAGGDYWKTIIERYTAGEIDGYETEECFAQHYCDRLKQSYKYVLNMPIRIKRNQHPKYRMIHATNHPAGCVLMANNMCNRWEVLKEKQAKGQLSLFQEDFNNKIIDASDIENQIINHFSKCDKWTSLTEAEACFFTNHGVLCKSGEISKILKKLEDNGHIAVKRNPSFSEKTGKPTSFMTEGHGQTVSIMWVK